MTKKARIYAVMNRKGGVGKTTTAATLAHGLALKMQGQGHVLAIDLDPQGSLGKSLGIRANGADLAHVLTGEKRPQDCIVPSGRKGLFVMPTSDALADARFDLMFDDVEASIRQAMRRRGRTQPKLDRILSERLAVAAQAFDFIIIDCPPSLDVLANAVFDFADSAIVPVKPDYLGTWGTSQHTDNIVQAQRDGIDISISWLVPTFYRPREVLARQMMQSLIRTYGKNRVATPIPQAVALEQAPADGGKTIFEFDPKSLAGRAYWQLVERVYNG
jgi:chromosome partitioning protein